MIYPSDYLHRPINRIQTKCYIESIYLGSTDLLEDLNGALNIVVLCDTGAPFTDFGGPKLIWMCSTRDVRSISLVQLKGHDVGYIRQQDPFTFAISHII